MSVARYYSWTEEEILFRLEHNIMDNAQYVMMDMPPVKSVNELVEALRSRFSVVASAEQCRVEIGRLRRKQMSLQELHLEVRRLVNKASPGCWSRSTEIDARDVFLTALDDVELRRRIIMAIPPRKTLAATYELAVRAAMADNAVSRSDNGPSRKQTYRACLLAEEAKPTEKEIQQQAIIDELREQISEMNTTLTTVIDSQKQSSIPGATSKANEATGPKTTVRLLTAGCWNCQQLGHLARNCPATKSKSQSKTLSQGVDKNNMLSAKLKSTVRVYMDISYEGHKFKALLDTGCDVSVISSRILPNIPYQKDTQNMFAANLSPVPILGTATVCFAVAGITLQNKFLFSDAVEEIM